MGASNIAEEQLAAACLLHALPRRRAFELIAQRGGAGAALLEVAGRAPSPDSVRRECERLDLGLVSFFDEDFPDLLQHIPDPPLLLYLRGNRALLGSAAVAVVGARRCSRGGAEIAASLAAALARAGLTIVSGLALGIDSAAHRGVLGLSGTAAAAVAVMGRGLGGIYPRVNAGLAQSIVARGGLLVSEYAPAQPPAKHRFPERNRLISGLSRGVVLVEANQRSGSLITARFALEQGREVMAVPGSLSGGRSGGCHRLLKQGAALVEEAADVCEVVGWPVASPSPAQPRAPVAELAPVLTVLGADMATLDEIAHDAGVSPERAAACLLRLELEGFVAQVPGGYIRRPPDL